MFSEFNIILDLAGVLFCGVCAVVVFIWRRMLGTPGRYFLAFLVTDMLLLAANGAGLYLKGRPGEAVHVLLRATNYLEFAASNLLCAAVTRYLFECVKGAGGRAPGRWVCTAYLAVTLTLLTVSQFNGMYYTIDAQNCYQRGRLYALSLLGGACMVPLDLYLVLKNRRRMSKRETVSFLNYLLLPAAGLLIDSRLYGFYSTRVATTVALGVAFVLMLATQVERFMAQERSLSEMKVRMLISQIQPHFLYNALAAIQYLCRTEPDAAAQAVEDFSCYLRGNMNILTTDHPIPLAAEIEHVRHYLALEKRRFGERLRVSMHLETTDFQVPPLSVQPLVENAVRCGMAAKMEGVRIEIAAWAEADEYVVRITDDGVGFDPAHYREDGAQHTGIDGVRGRLAAMCGGTLTLDSRPGQGTRAEIRIPRAPRKEDKACES